MLNKHMIHPPQNTVFGAYSLWPRAKRAPRRKVVLYSGGVLSVAVFAHCILPMLIAA